MASFPEAGKIDDEFFKTLIYPGLGAPREEVAIGPEYGVDVSVIKLPNGLAMAVTSDPLSLIPTLGLRESAWLSVQLMANDMATTGFAPKYAQFVLNLPPWLNVQDFETYWHHIHTFCEKLGVAITGGHTGQIEGQQSTIAGGGTMMTVAPYDELLTSKGAKPGDVLIVTKACAIISSSILALSFPKTVINECGMNVYETACELFYQTSSVEDSLEAAATGRHEQGVTAMHDVTEGGVLGAIHELSFASGCGVEVEVEKVPVGEAQKQVCDCFGIDPLFSVGAGALIITAHPGKAQSIIAHLQEKGIAATIIGRMMDKEYGQFLLRGERRKPLQHPGTDPYWKAFFRAFKEGLK